MWQDWSTKFVQECGSLSWSGGMPHVGGRESQKAYCKWKHICLEGLLVKLPGITWGWPACWETCIFQHLWSYELPVGPTSQCLSRNSEQHSSVKSTIYTGMLFVRIAEMLMLCMNATLAMHLISTTLVEPWQGALAESMSTRAVLSRPATVVLQNKLTSGILHWSGGGMYSLEPVLET